MKIVKIILVTALLFVYTNIDVCASAPKTSGRAAILMDGGSGRVLYEHNSRERLPMASTTKIMTAIVALEYGKLEDKITIPQEASGVEGSSILAVSRRNSSLEDLLYGLMLRSETMQQLPQPCTWRFGRKVCCHKNSMAEKIGAYDTNFVRPSWPSP